MTPPHIIVAAGSRHAADRSLADGALTVLAHLLPWDTALYVGDADGADCLFTAGWARLHGRTIAGARAEGLVTVFEADWAAPCTGNCQPGHRRQRKPGSGDYCPAAGPRRNDAMCAAAAATAVPVTTLILHKLGQPNTGTINCQAAMSRYSLPKPVHLVES